MEHRICSIDVKYLNSKQTFCYQIIIQKISNVNCIRQFYFFDKPNQINTFSCVWFQLQDCVDCSGEWKCVLSKNYCMFHLNQQERRHSKRYKMIIEE